MKKLLAVPMPSDRDQDMDGSYFWANLALCSRKGLWKCSDLFEQTFHLFVHHEQSHTDFQVLMVGTIREGGCGVDKVLLGPIDSL